MSATACQISDSLNGSLAVKHVTFTAPPFEEDVITKTNINVVDGKNKFAWSANDTVGIYPNSGSQIYFVVDAEEGAGTASFDGGGWEFKLGAVYRSYYPFIGDFYMDPDEIPVYFTGQKQTGNDNTNHIGPYDFMYTPAVSSSDGNLSFSYKHLCSILRPMIDLPAGHYTMLTLSVDDPLFTVTGSFDLTASSPAIVGRTFAQDFSIGLDITLSADEQMVVSMMSAPVDLQGKTLTVKVFNDQGKMFSYQVVPEEAYAASKIKKIISPVSFAIGSVSVDPTELSLYVDQTQQLTATVLPENAANKNVTWTSSNTAVASVSETGLVTALTSGTTTITVTTEEGEKSATCAVTVSEVPVSSVTLNKTSLSLLPGETETLTATVNPDNAGNKNVGWSSSNTNVATVSSSGLVTAQGVGSAVITVTTEDGGKTADCAVTVNAIEVTSVTLNQTSLSLTKGSTATLSATVLPNNATDKTVTWSSNETSVATVDANGKVTAKAGGTATITATAGSKSATCAVTVTVPVTGVSLNKTATSITIGGSETLTATVTPSDATNKNVTWSSSNTNIATVSNGKVTAKAVGTATITVTTADGNKTATCEVTVSPIAVTGIELDYTILTFISLNATQQLTATVTPTNATDQSVAWSSSDSNVATVSSSGLVTSKGSGSATITATAGGKSATCAVTVNIPVTGVSLNKTTLTLAPNATETLTATVTPSNATNKNVSWSSSNTNVATVSTAGKVTAVASGTATITVTTADGSKTATCAVTVTVPVTGVSLNKTSTSLLVGATETLTATITPSNATNKNVSWSSSATSVATVSNGTITAKAVGTTTITVTTADGNKTASCTVTVNPIEVTGISLNQTSLNFSSLNATQQLTATVTPSNATNKTVTWSSSDTNVATVSSSGLVTSKGSGSATITATAGSKSATCNVTVNIPVTGVTLNKSSITLSKNATEQLTATVSPSNATNKNVTWSSSSTSVATVSSSGLVTAKGAGTATITVTTEDGSKKATCSVTVTIPVTSVSLNKTSLTLAPNATETLTATVSPSNATNKNVTWSSSNTSVATVSSTGLVTAKALGTATITVTTEDGSKTASCSVTVQNVAVTGVSLDNTTLTLVVGSRGTLMPTVLPENATNKNVSWKSSNQSVVSVSGGGVNGCGLIYANAVGTATITVTTQDGSKTATCRVTVNAMDGSREGYGNGNNNGWTN